MSNLSDFLPWGKNVALDGPTDIHTDASETYTITNYNSFATYSVSVSAGSASRSGDTITLTAPSSAQTITLTVTIDGKSEDYSIVVTVAPDFIATPAATPSNFGDPFEGGFYAGMIWNQLTQSSTSTAIGTGSKTFTVPSMSGSPIVYGGQEIEIRSRANPNNKMVGTVTWAKASTLTVNVTSISGSGTFTDWSVMARFRIINAPKSSGENAGIAIKNANTALPSGCQTLNEGWQSTLAMFSGGNSTEYPAAHWARGLSIGGYDDWYIPARDELELAWRNLKPTTANYTTADRSTGQTFDYKIDGAYGDTANTHGLNNNSSPTGAAYTLSVPGQTAATAFRTGGAEAYEFGSANYWSSTEYGAMTAWVQRWYSSLPGLQDFNAKAGAIRVRAVRRSIV